MKIFNFSGKATSHKNKEANEEQRLLFASTAALERALDETDETYKRYYFALYRCSPDEPAGINQYREQLKQKHPSKSVQVGRYFVLWGEAAFQAVIAYHKALSNSATLPDDFREYTKRRIIEITKKHQISQELSVPIDLSEGQLCDDPNLTFYACLALENQQIIQQPKTL